MKTTAIALTLILASCASTSNQTANSNLHTRGIELSIGERQLNNIWQPLEEHQMVGLTYKDAAPQTIGWEVGLATSEDTHPALPGVKFSTEELFGGARYEFKPMGKFTPYGGAGISMISGKIETPSGNADESTTALYMHAGVKMDLSSNVSLGLDLRLLRGADVAFGGAEVDLNHEQLTLVLSFGF